MSPEDLLDPEQLPEDLHWLAAEFRLNPNDPVFLLIAWHWRRVQEAEDSLRSATLDLKTAVDRRIESLETAAATVATVNERLAQVQGVLEEKPLTLGRQLTADLQGPVQAAGERIRQLEQSLALLLRAADTTLARAQRRQAFAAFLIGLVLGGSLVGLCL